MIRKSLFLSLMVTSALIFSSRASAEMPKHVRDALNKLVGQWEVTTTVGEDTNEWELESHWSPTKEAVVYSWKGPDYITKEPNTGTGFLGWDAAKKLVVEFEIEGNGTVFTSTHYISKDGEWTSPTKATAMTEDGPVYVEVQRTFVFESDDELVIHGRHRIVDGEKQPDDKSVFKKQ